MGCFVRSAGRLGALAVAILALSSGTAAPAGVPEVSCKAIREVAEGLRIAAPYYLSFRNQPSDFYQRNVRSHAARFGFEEKKSPIKALSTASGCYFDLPDPPSLSGGRGSARYDYVCLGALPSDTGKDPAKKRAFAEALAERFFACAAEKGDPTFSKGRERTLAEHDRGYTWKWPSGALGPTDGRAVSALLVWFTHVGPGIPVYQFVYRHVE